MMGEVGRVFLLEKLSVAASAPRPASCFDSAEGKCRVHLQTSRRGDVALGGFRVGRGRQKKPLRRSPSGLLRESVNPARADVSGPAVGKSGDATRRSCNCRTR